MANQSCSKLLGRVNRTIDSQILDGCIIDTTEQCAIFIVTSVRFGQINSYSVALSVKFAFEVLLISTTTNHSVEMCIVDVCSQACFEYLARRTSRNSVCKIVQSLRSRDFINTFFIGLEAVFLKEVTFCTNTFNKVVSVYSSCDLGIICIYEGLALRSTSTIDAISTCQIYLFASECGESISTDSLHKVYFVLISIQHKCQLTRGQIFFCNNS